jgi:hypothetical protein
MMRIDVAGGAIALPPPWEMLTGVLTERGHPCDLLHG